MGAEAAQTRAVTDARQSAGDWFGQPRGLTILFLTAMWEIFSYYGMRALLVYYMVKQLMLGQERASVTYGLYTAFVYLTPIAGGLIADRWLGRRRAVLLGGSIMALGHFMMAFEPMFYVALAAIGIGNGLFLPNLPGQINGLYAPDDPRRKSAYNIYYVGINVGGFLAPVACGTVGELYGWHWGFTVAGIGMIFGLLIYVWGGRYLPSEMSPSRERHVTETASQEALNSANRVEILQRFTLLAGIAMVAVILRVAYEQVGNTVALWAERVDRVVGDFTIPMTWFQAFNPLLVMMLTPWLVAYWTRQARQGKEPTSMTKMSVGAGIIALSYLLLAGSAMWAEASGGYSSWQWLAGFFLVMTIGELWVLPIGLGLFGRLAPKGFTGTAIALWFLGAFAGNLLAGAFGTLWSQMSPQKFFALAAAIAGVAALLLLLFNRATERADSG